MLQTFDTRGTVRDARVVEVAKEFAKAGFQIIASKNTCSLIQEAGIEAEMVHKLKEGRPNMLDLITNGKIDLIINTPVGQELRLQSRSIQSRSYFLS